MDMELADASALYIELLQKFNQFQVHVAGGTEFPVADSAILLTACEWCGADLTSDVDMIRLNELVRRALTHLCASDRQASELQVLQAIHKGMERR